MKSFAVLLVWPMSVLATECVLQTKMVTQSAVVIQERANLRAEVVPGINGGRRCMVNFRARIGSEWHTAFGEYEWNGERPRDEACAVAVSRAEDSVREREPQQTGQ